MIRALISIIIPTYNREGILGEAIRSILGQSYPNFELIIIDDCSTDSTKELVRSIDDERIRYIRHEENMGPSHARNTGIQVAKGDYIAFQDSDDIWVPDKLMKQLELMESDSILGAVYTGYTKYFNDGTTQYNPSKEIDICSKEGYIYASLLNGNTVGTPTLLIKRECIGKVGMFDSHMKAWEDWDFILRVARVYKIGFIDESLVLSHFSADGVNSDSRKIVEAWCHILYKYKEDLIKEALLIGKVCHLVEHCINTDRKLIELIKGKLVPGIINNAWEFDIICIEAEKVCKFKAYYAILIKMSELDNASRYLEEYCEANHWRNIAIYGIGGIGNVLLKYLNDSNVIVRYGIEHSKKVHSNGIEIINASEIRNDIDVVIVTVMNEFTEIADELRDYTDCPIISVGQIF